MYVEVSKDYPLTYQINDYLMKKCTKCNEVKEPTEFYKDKRLSDGLQCRCKLCCKSYRRDRYSINSDCEKAWVSRWKSENPEKVRSAQNRHHKKKYASDPAYRLVCRMRKRVRKAIRSNSKSASTIELLGCTAEHARFHIESQFTDGMTWDNIHVDHIQPCASFDLGNEDEQRKCFHYTNLQPLFASDNIRKSDSIVHEHQVKLL